MQTILVSDAKAKRNLMLLVNGTLALLIVVLILGLVTGADPMANLLLFVMMAPFLWLRHMYSKAEIATYKKGAEKVRRILEGKSATDRWLLRRVWWRKMYCVNKEQRRGMEEALEAKDIN